MGPVTTFYEEVGGLETFRTIVTRFYEGVAEDDVLRPLYPEAKEHWLHHFRAGMDAADLTPEQDAKLWDYVTHAAQFMVNTLH